MPLVLTIAFTALIAGGIVMGFSPVFVREAEVGAFASAFWRVVFALPCLFVWSFCERRGLHDIFSFTPAVVLAGIFFSGDLIFWHLAILNTTMANATFMICLAPVWVAVISPFMLGERINKSTIAGLLFCISGLVFLLGSSLQGDPDRLIGDLYGLATSIFLGLYFIAMRVARKSLTSGSFFLSSTIITAFVLLGITFVEGKGFYPHSATGWTSVVLLGVVGHAGGQGLVTLAIGSLGVIFTSLVVFIEAVSAAFFGWILFSENLAPMQWAGCILIVFGVWFSKPEKIKA